MQGMLPGLLCLQLVHMSISQFRGINVCGNLPLEAPGRGRELVEESLYRRRLPMYHRGSSAVMAFVEKLPVKSPEELQCCPGTNPWDFRRTVRHAIRI